jgi:ribose transport system substrate-binding protein
MRITAKILTLFLFIFLLNLNGCQKESNKDKWVIGFSQVTVKEPWRVVFNENLKKKAEQFVDKIELIILDADDKTENQVEHIKTFISKRVDAILISPKDASGCSKAIKEAAENGIPVIVLDRDITYKGYAAYVGADNRLIGQEAGKYVVNNLMQKKEHLKVYEICGSLASTPGQERRAGFHEIVEKQDNIEIIGGLDGDWKLDKAKAIAQDALQIHNDIDVIYAHNDPMAYGAYQAAKELGLENKIKFIGIDGLPHEGCLWVKNGILAASFLYPTPGEKGLEIAMEILSKDKEIQAGEKIMIPTITITEENVDSLLIKKE